MSFETSELDDEILVAYLDGELPTDEADAVRARITRDPELKKRVEELQASWALLDQLPVPSPNPALAQSTIELITQGIAQSEQVTIVNRLRQFRWYALAIVSAATVLVGVWISSSQNRSFQQSVVSDLFVLTHLRELESIDSQDWLDKLTTIDNLERVGLPLYTDPNFPELPARGRDLKGWIEGLDINQKQSLQTSYRSFGVADPPRQEQLRKLAKRLSDPGQTKLLNLVKAYYGILNKRADTVEAIQIAGETDLEKRKSEILQIVNRELAVSYSLSDEEKSHIVDWCDQLKARSFYFVNADDPDVEIIRLLDVETPDSNIQTEDIEKLVQCVEPTGRDLLQNLDPSLQTRVLKLWVYSSLPTTRPRKQYASSELLERFRKLSSQRQNQLIYLPSTEVVKTLSQEDSDSTLPELKQ